VVRHFLPKTELNKRIMIQCSADWSWCFLFQTALSAHKKLVRVAIGWSPRVSPM